MAIFAYVRFSTKEQNIDRQLAALEPYNIPKRNIFCDHQSGKDVDCPAYQKMLKRLKSGDLLIVKSIDRQGRNYKDILIECSASRRRSAQIFSLSTRISWTPGRRTETCSYLTLFAVCRIVCVLKQTIRHPVKI